jgi:hypothetical protein
VLVALASLLFVAVAASPAAAVSPDRATLARMNGAIRDGMDRSGVPGGGLP